MGFTAGSVITDAVSVWERLVDTGLSPTTYDEDFTRRFALQLGCDPDRSIKSELLRVKPTVTRAIAAFLASAEPFARMASDVWTMFVEADARSSDENFEIAFDFSAARLQDLHLKLEHFKVFHEQVASFRAAVRLFRISGRSLWALQGVLRDLEETPLSVEADRWKQAYDSGEWRAVPPAPAQRERAAGQVLARARALIAEVITLLDGAGARPRQGVYAFERARGAPLGDSPADSLLRELCQAESDHWVGAFLTRVDMLAGRLLADRNDPAASRALGRLATMLDEISTVEEREIVDTRLEEFLNLPAWKFRHQLFGLWTAARIAQAVGYRRMRFHPVNGALRFGFKATHIATVECDPPLHLVAELRTSARTLLGKGRTRSIQPDWRLVGSPFDAAESQVLIVECKQYARPKSRSFLETVVDYAANAANAHVALVNYGAMDVPSLRLRGRRDIGDAWERVEKRITLIGSFQPGAASVDEFDRIVDGIVPKAAALPARSPEDPLGLGQLVLSLWWPDSGVDLDLHIVVRHLGAEVHRVNYGNQGSLKSEPWCRLEEDVRRGGAGAEMATIGRLLPASYGFWAHVYSEGARFPPGSRFTIRGEGFALEVAVPSGSGRAWHIGDLDGLTGHWGISGRLCAEVGDR